MVKFELSEFADNEQFYVKYEYCPIQSAWERKDPTNIYFYMWMNPSIGCRLKLNLVHEQLISRHGAKEVLCSLPREWIKLILTYI